MYWTRRGPSDSPYERPDVRIGTGTTSPHRVEVLAKDLAGTADQPLGIDRNTGLPDSRHQTSTSGNFSTSRPVAPAWSKINQCVSRIAWRDLVAKSVQQPVHGLFRTRINDYSVEEVGRDRPRLVEMEQVNGFRDVASHGAEITGRRTK